MCSLAPRAAAPGFGATAFLDRQRGVVAAVAPAAAASGHNAGEPTRRARDSEVSTAPARKRGRHDGFEHVVVVDPAASSALRIRMDAELVALEGLLKRAKLLPRSAPLAEKNSAPPPRSEVPTVSSSAAKRSTTSQSKAAATEAAYLPQITAPAAANSKRQQQRPVQNPINKVEVPNSKQRPAAAPPAAAKQQQHPVQRAAAAKTEAPKKRSSEELALAAARVEFRQMLLEMEKAALPDETIYPEDLEELGIAPFEHAVTRTRKQAWLEDQANKKWSLQRAAVKNPIAPQVPSNKQRPAAPSPAEEDLARAKAREKFRRMLREMEKAVPPDEMVYPEELEELGIVPRHRVGVIIAV